MSKALKESFIWRSFLNELTRKKIITKGEKKRITTEYSGSGLVFKNISLSQKTILLKLISSCLKMDKEGLKNHASELQDYSLVNKNRVELTKTWLSIDAYAEKHDRHIVSFIHALMACYIKSR